MNTTKEQQKELDDALVAPENRLKIGKSNLRLSSNLKSKEPTIQVVLDALKLTPFYNAFEISADVPEIYMQEFWVTVTRHHSSLRFKLDGKSHTVNVDNFRDMLKICPKLPGQKFEEPPLEEDILSFIRDLGHTGEIKFLSDVNVNHMHQPWRSFAVIINKCLSGKTTALENLVFQVENKNSKKTNDMYYPCFTKVIVDYFMAKDQAIPRRNKMFWHYDRDDFMFTTLRVISKHKDTQEYGAILPQHLTNPAMLESEAFKTYRAYATSEKAPKSKATKKKTDSESSPKIKPSQASKGKRIKTSAKGDKPTITKSKGLTILSEVVLSEAEQMKLSKVPNEQQQTLSCTNEGDGDKPEVLVVPEYKSESEEESWTFGQGDDDEESDEHDTDEEEEEKEEEKAEDDDEVTSDQKVSTSPDYELTEEDVNQEDDDTMGEDQDDEENGEQYRDLNLNMDRQDAKMTNAQTNQETKEAHVTLTNEPPVVQQQSSSVSSDLVAKFINPSPDTGIDSLLNQNVAVSVTPSSDTTIPQPPIPIIQPQQQTHDSTTTTTIPTTTLPEIPNFASLFGFNRRVSSLEIELSKLKQTNQFAEAVASIPGIVDKYLASKVKDTIDVAVQLKSDKLREEAQAENQDFLNSLDSNMKKIIKEQVKAQTSKIMSKVEKYVTDTLGAKVLVRSTNQPPTSYAVSSSLSELELKKILMGKMEENKSIDRLEVQKNLYNALVEAYNSDKDLLSSYGDVVTILRGHDDEDKDEEPSAGSNRGTKRRRSGKEAESSKELTHKESRTTSTSKRPSISQQTNLEDPTHQEFITGDDDVSPVREVTNVDERLWNPTGSRTPNCEWNKTKTIDDRPPQPWMTNKPLPLILDARGRLIIPYDHFINNDFEYLKGGSSSRKYTTSITKTKAADYGHIKWIEDKIPRSTWSEAQGKLKNLNVDEWFALNVALRMYTRRIIIQERVEDLQLAVESNQKKINLTKPDTYRSDISKKTPYTAYHDIQGIIYQDDMNRNRLMRTDELHKFSDGTLNHVRTNLNDIATGIQMEYLPKRKWSKQDKQRA
ncbi:hypothetical protein Tco_0328788 [Tanacetum coccineum]